MSKATTLYKNERRYTVITVCQTSFCVSGFRLYRCLQKGEMACAGVAIECFFTVRCAIVQGAVLRSHVVRPSVCLSVRLWRWWIMNTKVGNLTNKILLSLTLVRLCEETWGALIGALRGHLCDSTAFLFFFWFESSFRSITSCASQRQLKRKWVSK